jgi:hypothetical protein
MRDLNIKGKDHSPTILFKPGDNVYEISGESRPENARMYYMQVIDWIEDFSHYTALHKGEPKEYRFIFKMEYMNSISTKIIFDILKRLEKLPQAKVVVEWHYQSDDIDMQENGEEYAKMVDLPFEFFSHSVGE